MCPNNVSEKQPLCKYRTQYNFFYTTGRARLPHISFVNISTVLKTNKICGHRPPAGIQTVATLFNRTRTVPLKKVAFDETFGEF